jgi:hypothetical protein
LVVLRILPNENVEKTKGPRTYAPKEATESDGTPEYTSISWESGDQLSVDLALWWMHLLATSKGSIRWGYPPLAEETLKPSDQRRVKKVRTEKVRTKKTRAKKIFLASAKTQCQIPQM